MKQKRRMIKMNDKLDEMVSEELKKWLDDISIIENADERAKAMEQYLRSYNTYLEGKKTKAEEAKLEAEAKSLIVEAKKERWTKIGIAGAGLAFNVCVLIFGLNFEKTGTITSGIFKWGLNHLNK